MIGGWLRRRLRREHQKLLYQNSRAAEGSLAGYFWNNEQELNWLAGIATEVTQASERVGPDGLLANDDFQGQIKANRELRRLYDSTASRHVKSFDEAHTPQGGRKAWYAVLDI